MAVKVRGFDLNDMEFANDDRRKEAIDKVKETNSYCPKYTVIVPSVASPKESKWLKSPIMPLEYEIGLLDCTIGPYARYTLVVDGIIVFEILIDAVEGSSIEDEDLEKLRAYFRFESDENLLEDRYMHIEKIDVKNLRLNLQDESYNLLTD